LGWRHTANVLLAIGDQPLQLLLIEHPVQDVLVLAFARFPWPRHQPHQPDTLAIFLILKPKCLREEIELGGVAVGERQRHRTVLHFDRNRRESVFGHQHVLEHGALKFRIVSDRAPFVRIAGRFEKGCRNRLSGQPDVYIAVIDREAEA
jgi:hypothetical protein